MLGVAAAIFLMVASTPAVAAWLQHVVAYPSQFGSVTPTQPEAAAIVVLGGGKTDDEWMVGSRDLRGTRLGVGRELLLSHRAPLILLSGGKGEALWMKSRLLALGVPPARILVEDHSRNTHENALDSAPILRRLGARRILLVTSDLHMRRAAACFRQQGFEVVPAPSPGLSGLQPDAGFWRSRRHAWAGSVYCLHEIIGLWIYRCLGWA